MQIEPEEFTQRLTSDELQDLKDPGDMYMKVERTIDTIQGIKRKAEKVSGIEGVIIESEGRHCVLESFPTITSQLDHVNLTQVEADITADNSDCDRDQSMNTDEELRGGASEPFGNDFAKTGFGPLPFLLLEDAFALCAVCRQHQAMLPVELRRQTLAAMNIEADRSSHEVEENTGIVKDSDREDFGFFGNDLATSEFGPMPLLFWENAFALRAVCHLHHVVLTTKISQWTLAMVE